MRIMDWDPHLDLGNAYLGLRYAFSLENEDHGP